MKNRTQIWKILAFLGAILFLSDTIYAQQWTSDSHSEYKRDTLPFSQRFIHRLGVEGRAGYIFSRPALFLEYSNHQYKAMKNAYAGHLKYSFQLRPHTVADQAYIGAYQGDWSRLFQLRQSGRAGQTRWRSICFKGDASPNSAPAYP